ncbi:MAG: hypothetical protein M3081_07000 [Gemmatimonadota bacterium]|nr:hypothetical protein [Gemmatimonadota bacterium]
MRTIRRIAGIIWFLSWFELYLELFRFHHVAVPAFARALSASPAVVPGGHPGGWLRTDLVCAVVAPAMWLALSLALAVGGSHFEARAARRDPAFPLAYAMAGFGFALGVLGTINQLIWQPPFTVDLTLQSGNGGFILLGGVCLAGGLLLSRRRGQAATTTSM